MQVREVLNGVGPGQQEVEIATGLGGGDCGFAFQVGADYVVYAYRNSEGRLETGICSRTRLLSQAAEDVEYIRSMANAPALARFVSAPLSETRPEHLVSKSSPTGKDLVPLR